MALPVWWRDVAAVPEDVREPSDAELAESVRAGHLAAYGTLYERHVAAARNLARQVARSTTDADELVSEAFARVLDVLRAGKGPDAAFRAYLFTALRHIAYDRTRRERRFELTDDISTVGGVDPGALYQPFDDPAVAELDRGLAVRAFTRLPERWQAVLWHMEIEGQSPAEVGPLFGLTGNAVSALACRAREGLRQAYLQVHLAETTTGRCRATADKLGAWTRERLSRRETVQVEAHLDRCARCRELAAELADVNSGLRMVAVALLGPAAVAYLATTRTAAVASTTTAAGTGATVAAAATIPHQIAGVGVSVATLATVVVLTLVPNPTTPPAAAGALSPTTTTAGQSVVRLAPGTGSTSSTADPSTTTAGQTTGATDRATSLDPAAGDPADPTQPPPGTQPGQAGQPPVAAAPCSVHTHVNVRWHYALAGNAGTWSATGPTPCPGSASIGPAAMEGNLTVQPGTTLRAGYEFTLPGTKNATTVTVGRPQVVFAVQCVSGAAPTASTLTMAMPTQSYAITNGQWPGSGDPSDPSTFQGSVTVPNLCGGGALNLSRGGTFTASLS